MMKVIECPTELTKNDGSVRVFLGGGISGCPDWQKEMIDRFKYMPDDFVLVNPRRSSFDISDPTQSEFQIDWEYRHIRMCDAMIFWFPYNTLCPITLFELGQASVARRTMFVGCHPAYPRKFDVEKQLEMEYPTVTVHDNFEPIVQEVKDWYRWIPPTRKY
jgi:hypothetical protein